MIVSHLLKLLIVLFKAVSEVVGVSGGWGDWGDWSGCSVTCGFGSISRSRNWITNDGIITNYTYIAIVECWTEKPCPIHGGWSVWNAWTECTVMCGNGTKTRMRECISPKPSEDGGKDCVGDRTQDWTCNTETCPELPANFDIYSCSPNHTFMCYSSLQCVNNSERCDGELHCHDGSDEAECYYKYLSINSSTDFPKPSFVLRLIALFMTWILPFS